MAQQQLSKCTAEEFAQRWRKYDTDGNGYIEDSELTNFLSEIAGNVSKGELETFKRDFMKKYDRNQDGKIDMRELAKYLQPEESFLLLIRSEGGPSSQDFTKVWSKYDADSSGYIESSELTNFLRDAYDNKLSEDKLKEYTRAALSLYDKDGNGKLDVHEMVKLLPLNTNYLTKFQFDKLSQGDFESILAHYDRNNDGTIEDSELDKLLGDLLRKCNQPATPQAIADRKKVVMGHCDKNKDGKLQLNELKLVLKF